MICNEASFQEGKCIGGKCDNYRPELTIEIFKQFKGQYRKEKIEYYRWKIVNLTGRDGKYKRWVSNHSVSVAF